MHDPANRKYRRLEEVVPAAYVGVQANFCRNPSCPNFGVAPRRLRPGAEARNDRLGDYKLEGEVGKTDLVCLICWRKTKPLSNVALVAELYRLGTANGILVGESCRNEDCDNHRRSVADHPHEYGGYGRTPSGAPRRRCKRCNRTVTVGDHSRSKKSKFANQSIVLDLVNRNALNAIMRKQDMSPSTLYDRIDFIHERMVLFETFKLKALRKPFWKRKHYFLATDAQDHDVNWESKDRRVGIQLSTITTAENVTGFIFRTDVNFDPNTGDIVENFISMLERGEFSVPEGLGPSHRFVLPSMLRAVAHRLKAEGNPSGLPEWKRDQLLAKIEELFPTLLSDEAAEPIMSDNPIRGALIKKQYTAIAHFILISELLPSDADLHLISDPEGAFVVAEPVGFAGPLKEQRADLTFVTFDKKATNPTKKGLVAKYKRKLQQFIDQHGQGQDASAIRKAFIAVHGVRLSRLSYGVPADWWSVPIETMYEPSRKVGIAYQRPAGFPDEREERRLELLDRASLHAVDSFFNVLRQRVSFFHRAGKSRSSETFYNAFQPYRPDMVQKIADIARVYFNWVEKRPFRLARNFESMDPYKDSPGHEKLPKGFEEQQRRSRREDFTTPAMRMHLASGPVELATILNTDWRAKLATTETVGRKRRKKPKVKPQQPPASGGYGEATAQML